VKTVLHLPFPPSVNSLYDGGQHTKRRFISDHYKAWLREAGLVLLTQPARLNRHVGPVEVLYTFSPPDKRRRDLFNLEKSVSDLLVKQGVIADDSLIHRGTVEWGAGSGVRVEVTDLQPTNERNQP
jgi:Holliday junction resolvase RusA-like endonuclease